MITRLDGRMRRPGAIAGAAGCLALAAALACSPHSLPAKTTDAKDAASENSESEASSSARGSGHLHLTGDVTADTDFPVDGCQIGKPGDGLLDGYRMHAEDGDSSIIQLSVVLKNYAKDGSFTADTSSESQLKQGLQTGSFGPLSLMIAQHGSPMPLAFMLKPTSSLVINVSDNGSKGEAKIDKMETQVSLADMNMTTREMPTHGKIVSGAVTWSCGHVDHLNGEMSKAVDGMMNKLMPH